MLYFFLDIIFPLLLAFLVIKIIELIYKVIHKETSFFSIGSFFFAISYSTILIYVFVDFYSLASSVYLFFGIPTNIIAIIFGILSIVKKAKGKNLAIIAIILAVLQIILFLFKVYDNF